MRSRIAALLLFAVLPVMSVLAAPAPNPYAILDIGPPEPGDSAELHCKRAIDALGDRWFILSSTWGELKPSKLPCIEAWKDPRPWMEKNIRITREDTEGRRLRLTFRAGSRAEQVAILNAVVGVYLQLMKEHRKFLEFCIQTEEACIPSIVKLIASERDPRKIQEYQKSIEELRSSRIPATRARLARTQQIVVVRPAK